MAGVASVSRRAQLAEVIGDGDREHERVRFAIQHERLVLPLLDSLDGRRGQQRMRPKHAAMAVRGFASMDSQKRREVAASGGRAAHAAGKAHQWSSDEARAASYNRTAFRGIRETRAECATPAR